MSWSKEASVWAFVDEYGNSNLDTSIEHVSSLFIVVAVLVPQQKLDELRQAASSVRARHFQSGKMEVKSKKKLKQQDLPSWQALVRDLRGLDFKFYALSVDKRRLDRGSGFRWNDSFYKNLYGRAYGRVMAGFPGLHVRADRYGDLEFKESFGRYIKANHRPGLFDRGTFDWADEGDPLVELADILCGLLARCYDPTKHMERAKELLGELHQQVLVIDEWPVRFALVTEHTRGAGTDDPRIVNYSVQQAEQFIRDHQANTGQQQECQVALVERLLFMQRFGDKGDSLTADSLYEHLENLSLEPRGKAWLRREVISPLRDAGVVITSSSSGYRLPTSAADFEGFASHAESVCLPMLRRVKAACDVAALVTSGETRILGDPRFAALTALVEAVTNKESQEPDP